MDTVNARQAYELRLSGHDEFEIAEQLGLSVDEAISLADEWSSALPSPSTTEARRTEVGRVDTWLRRVDAEYIAHSLPIDKAVTAFCKLSERRCKLLGLDAPTRAEMTALLTATTPSSVDDEVQRLAEELGLR